MIDLWYWYWLMLICLKNPVYMSYKSILLTHKEIILMHILHRLETEIHAVLSLFYTWWCASGLTWARSQHSRIRTGYSWDVSLFVFVSLFPAGLKWVWPWSGKNVMSHFSNDPDWTTDASEFRELNLSFYLELTYKTLISAHFGTNVQRQTKRSKPSFQAL